MYLNVTLSATDTEGFCNADIAASVFLKKEDSYHVKHTEISKHCSIITILGTLPWCTTKFSVMT